ncbi:MAG: hypothetical protein AVDCRST_MAG02-4276 [uncultured Rubrobacteraceae bacterium]|uniref:DUF3618 domain-containing protein n=1 Tax=uncultured Rubrobacteraceae bacterium TaxID=349277 RepID=A0A6J4RQH5_9ACTN|nr:MAG: hypothetical protein AVDCRST_MAG02-4276 [uncultured Rubrobacteraceae bacterium]
MDQRPDAVGRDPLGGGTPGFDPATDAFDPDAVRDPVVDGGTEADEVGVDRVEVTRVEIERTRADMSETVDAIQERLSPQNLKDQAKDRVKEATVGRAREARSGVVDTVRSNPLPAALTGIGLGWLLMSARQQNQAQPHYRDDVSRYRTPTNEYAPVAREYPLDDGYEGNDSSSAGEALGRARDRVGETATQAQDKAGDLAGRAKGGASDLGSQTREKAGQLGSRARQQAGRAGSGFQRMLHENPLTVGALAIGAGAAIGLAIPETAKEHEVMGEARDTVVEKAQEKAQDAQQRVQRVAEEAQGAAQQEAENQGLKQQ